MPSPADVGQPINPPPAGTLAPSAPIDWQQAIRGEVRAQETRRGARKLQFGLPQAAAPEPAASPEFGWYYARTHRVQMLPAGGMLINLNDRCMLVVYGTLFPVCRVGDIPANGHLFDHMRDPRNDRPDGLP